MPHRIIWTSSKWWGKLAVTTVVGQFLVCALNCRLFLSWNLSVQSMSSSWDKDTFRVTGNSFSIYQRGQKSIQL